MSTPMTPAEIRAQAMAMLAQADEAEEVGIVEVEDPNAHLVADPQVEYVQAADEGNYAAWAFERAEQITDPMEAWEFVAETWDELDGTETLNLVGILMPHMLSEAEPEPEPEPERTIEDYIREGFSLAEAQAIMVGVPASVVTEARSAPQVVATPTVTATGPMRVTQTLRVPAGAVLGLRPVQRPSVAPEPPVAEREPAPAPAQDGPPPRGMKRKPRPTVNPESIQLNTPRATGAPRQRSRHEIPDHLNQWTTDAAGRRVPREG